MTKMLDFLRALLVGPEVVGLALAAALTTWAPELMEGLGNHVHASDLDLGSLIVWLGVGSLPASFAIVFRILFPKEDSRLLVAAKGYERIKMRAILGVIWSALGAATTVALLLLLKDLGPALAGGLYLAALLAGWTSTATLGLAALKAREVVESASGSDARNKR